MSVRSTVTSVVTEVAAELHRKLAPLSDDLSLLESGLDSLCLATIVARLENLLGKDPFSSTEDGAIPTTFGEFVALYEHAIR